MSESNACPKCGYCPHCGRSNAAPMRIWWNPPYPQPQPTYPIYWDGGGGIQSTPTTPYGTAHDATITTS